MKNHTDKMSLRLKLKHLVSTHLMAVIGFSVLINLLQLTVPLYMMQVFDRVLPGKNSDTLIYLTLMATMAIVCWGGLYAIRQKVFITISGWLDKQLGLPMFKKSLAKVLEGDLYATQAFGDLTELRSFVNTPSAAVVFDFPWIPIYILVVFFIHPLLGFITVAGAVILLLLTYNHERTLRVFIDQAQAVGGVPKQLYSHSLRKADSVMAMGMREGLGMRWNLAQNMVIGPLQSVANRTGNYLATVRTFRMIIQLALLGTGGYLAMIGSISGGAMIAASIIGGRALQPVEQLTGAWAALLRASGAYTRLEQFLEEEEEHSYSIDLPDPKGYVTVENMGYKYPENEKPTLLGIMLQASPGSCLGIIGPSGAGKSTLLKTVVGVIAPGKGHVRLDGAELHQWQAEKRGKHIGYLGQTVELFPGSIGENIARMGIPVDEEVIAAAQKSGAHEMILQLPQGYDTPISAMGTGLSGGQMQRIALARALYGKPKLIVLDEPGSNLDVQGIAALAKAIHSLKKEGCTVIMTTHQQNLLKVTDQLFVLNADGTPCMVGPTRKIIEKLKELSGGEHGAKQGPKNQ